ncbi:Ribonuclease P protein subunit p25 [Zea mays]|uniref:Ribonuclease P protein subunit p25 n=1 Tax=Zea mays TaxID=4577 RepID=A0A3L6G517_MAIZE|nr:Ribonuclease P protein subunit p25 [Zea mays]
MDRYQRVEKPREESPIGANEIRITAQGRPRNYITYALALLQDNATDDIVIKAMGRAINKTVAIVELLKRRIAGLHQNTSIESIDITDTWEPLEEGLVTYQPPIPADQRPYQVVVEEDVVVAAGAGEGEGGSAVE